MAVPYAYDGVSSPVSTFLSGPESFPCPFEDIASLHFPRSWAEALRWVEWMVSVDGVYWRALDRVLSYFLTDIEITDIGDDERDEWYEYLHDSFDIRRQIRAAGMDLMCYGNSFVSILPPFRRYLYCGNPRCRFDLPLAEVYNNREFRFRWQNFEFHASCPKCQYNGQWHHIDRHGTTRDRIRMRRWSPHDIDIQWDLYTDECAYIWRIPGEYRRNIREGKLFFLERCAWEVVQAIKHDANLRFDRDTLFHLKEDSFAGHLNRGWGIPRPLHNFRQAWHVQVYRRYNEALGLDYIIPFRLITPAPGDKQAGTDVLLNMNAGNAAAQIRRMVRDRRKDPAGFHTLPFAVQYQVLGGEARQLAPVELMKFAQETLLNAIGIPVELFQGSLSLQTAPVALRVFESMWTTLPHMLNGLLRFIVGAVARIQNWQEPGIKLSSVTTADDVNLLTLKMQMMSGGQISPSSGLRLLGMDFHDETRRTLEDERYRAEMQQKLQRSMEAAGMMQQQVTQGGQQQPGAAGGAPQAGGGGAAPQGGSAPPAGGGAPPGGAAQDVASGFAQNDNVPITPQELEQRTSTAAQTLMTMPPSQRYSELHKLEKINPTAHAIVVKKLEKIRSEAKREGGAQVLQQQFGVAH